MLPPLPSLPGIRTTIAEIGPAPRVDRIDRVDERSLRDLARPGMNVVIAFTDATRHSPDRILVGHLLDELAAAGVRGADITLLCALGLHRPMTAAERIDKLGEEIVRRIRIVDHDALDPTELVDLGTIEGIPVIVDRRCVEADLLLATGVVEPHQYAGYSGGSKTVVIGCGGEETIRRTHGPEMLDEPGTRLGAIEGNPFQRFVRRAGSRIGLDYVANALLDESGEMIAAAAGGPDDVHDDLVRRARSIYETTVPHPAHIAVVGVSRGKEANLYQASRAVTYLALAERTPLRAGAPIVLQAAIPEGAGEGAGEKKFFEFLAGTASPAELVERLRSTGFPAGAQRAYVLANVLRTHPVIVAGAEHPETVQACHMLSAPDLKTAIGMAVEMAKDRFRTPTSEPLDLLAVPNALVTLPKLAP